MKSAGIVFAILLYALIIAAAIAGVVGYWINICDLITMVGNHSADTGMELLRALGVVVGPLGSILGLLA